MATRKRGGGHGSMSAKKYRKSMQRLRESIRAADASMTQSMSSRMNAMNNGNSLRRSARRCVASASSKSLRKRMAEHQKKAAKKLAESYVKIMREVKATEAAAKRASMDNLVAKTGAMKLNNGCAMMGGKRSSRRNKRN